MTTTAIFSLKPRPCELRESDHRYIWTPTGEEMAISVTGVTSFGKPPYDGPPEAGWRGTHVHRAMQAIAEKQPLPDHISPEGINTLEWFEQLGQMDFWEHSTTIACEYTMVHRRKSLGGQLDLLCSYKSPKSGERKTILVDLKTKGASWNGPSSKDIASYRAQAGGYLTLLDSGDEAHGGCWVDTCMTLVVTPRIVKWLPPMTPQSCLDAWFDCWDRYALAGELNPF